MEGHGNGPAHSEVSSTKEEPGDGTDLELGLSLGTKNRASGNTAGLRPRLRGDCCRILTAEDLGSRSPRSSSSSVSSSSSATPPSGGGRGAGCPPSSHGVVGWPPIRTYRMNSLANHTKDNTSDTETSACKKRASICYSEEPNRHDDHEIKKGFVASSFFVKVNMDGDPIGRKIDLNAHLSYDTLALVLEVMFSSSTTTFCTSPDGLKASKLLDGSSEFTLTYEDKDGDWMLVGDVPWRMFLNTVKRLRIMRTADANGLAPRLEDDCKDVVPASKQA